MSFVPPYGFQYNPGQIDATTTPNVFEILLDAKHFVPEDFSIRVVDRVIYIDAERTQRQPGYPVKYIKYHVHRQFNLPPQFDPANIVSGISPDGMLSVRCIIPYR